MTWNQVGVSFALDFTWHNEESMSFNGVVFTPGDANNQMMFLSNFKPAHETCDTHGVLIFKCHSVLKQVVLLQILLHCLLPENLIQIG